jgi:photosystem II oxygen-evolving enhancer protein 2
LEAQEQRVGLLFRLANLGSPEEVGSFLLNSLIAPQGSGKEAKLLESSMHRDASGIEYYELEYQVQKVGGQGWSRHNIAVLCAHQGILFTFNAQVSAEQWKFVAPIVRRASASFRVQLR